MISIGVMNSATAHIGPYEEINVSEIDFEAAVIIMEGNKCN